MGRKASGWSPEIHVRLGGCCSAQLLGKILLQSESESFPWPHVPAQGRCPIPPGLQKGNLVSLEPDLAPAPLADSLRQDRWEMVVGYREEFWGNPLLPSSLTQPQGGTAHGTQFEDSMFHTP